MKKVIKDENRVKIYSVVEMEKTSGWKVNVKAGERETTLEVEQDMLSKINKKIASLATQKIKQEAIIAQIQAL